MAIVKATIDGCAITIPYGQNVSHQKLHGCELTWLFQ